MWVLLAFAHDNSQNKIKLAQKYKYYIDNKVSKILI